MYYYVYIFFIFLGSYIYIPIFLPIACHYSQDVIDRISEIPEVFLGNMRIPLGGPGTVMPQPLLYVPQIGSLFQMMCRKTMPQNMRVYPLFDTCLPGSPLDDFYDTFSTVTSPIHSLK